MIMVQPPPHHHHSPAYASQRELSSIGPYKLLTILGQGEFGKVRLAKRNEFLSNDALVAIKLIDKQHQALVQPDASPFRARTPSDGTLSKRERLQREISILQSLKHPNIIQLLQVLESDHYIGMVMTYAPGGELFDYILHQGRLTEFHSKDFFAQLISAVSYLHSQNVVHRDLKLENILLNQAKDCIYISDFGFSNLCGISYRGQREDDKDWMLTSCGSPCYAAPEIVTCEGGYSGKPADVWSCGVILFAMLAGYLPWDDDESNPNGADVHALYNYILGSPLQFPNDCISGNVRHLLEHILVIDPDDRLTINEICNHSWLAKIPLSTYTKLEFASDLDSSHVTVAQAEPLSENNIVLPFLLPTDSGVSVVKDDALVPAATELATEISLLSFQDIPVIENVLETDSLLNKDLLINPSLHAACQSTPQTTNEDTSITSQLKPHTAAIPEQSSSHILEVSDPGTHVSFLDELPAWNGCDDNTIKAVISPANELPGVSTDPSDVTSQDYGDSLMGTVGELSPMDDINDNHEVPANSSTTVRFSEMISLVTSASYGGVNPLFQFGWFNRHDSVSTKSIDDDTFASIKPVVQSLPMRPNLAIFNGPSIDPRAVCTLPLHVVFLKIVDKVSAYPLLISKMDVPSFKLRIGHKFLPASAVLNEVVAKPCLSLFPCCQKVHAYPRTTSTNSCLHRMEPIAFEQDPLYFIIQIKHHSASGQAFVDFELRRGSKDRFRAIYDSLLLAFESAGGLSV